MVSLPSLQRLPSRLLGHTAELPEWMHVKPITPDPPSQHSPTTTLTVQHLRNSPMRDCMGDVACDETGAVAAVAACVDGGLVRCYSKSTANPAGILQNLLENRKKILSASTGRIAIATALQITCAVCAHIVSCEILVSRYHQVSTRPLRLLGPR